MRDQTADVTGSQPNVIGLTTDVRSFGANVSGFTADVTGLMADVTSLRLDADGLKPNATGSTVYGTALWGNAGGSFFDMELVVIPALKRWAIVKSPLGSALICFCIHPLG
jgi:hypothetical protein